MEHLGLMVMGGILTAGVAVWLGTGIVITYRNIKELEKFESSNRP